MKKEELLAVLEKIREERGILTPKEVVEVATPEDHPLHKYFIWDDTEAARRFRLEQARSLLRVAVTVIGKDEKPIRAYVSLVDDRQRTTNGDSEYRCTIDVLNDDALRKQLLKQAFAEFEGYREKYEQLSELAPLFKTAKRLEGKYVS